MKPKYGLVCVPFVGVRTLYGERKRLSASKALRTSRAFNGGEAETIMPTNAAKSVSRPLSQDEATFEREIQRGVQQVGLKCGNFARVGCNTEQMADKK